MENTSDASNTDITQTSPDRASTPLSSGPAARSEAGSLLNPRKSFSAEAANLQNLNDRLASYIERVINLEKENARLALEAKTTQESTTVNNLYETELAEARQLLDQTSHDMAKLQIDMKNFWYEKQELQRKLEKKTVECARFDELARKYETRFTEYNAKYCASKAEHRKVLDELEELRKEHEHVTRQLEISRQNESEEKIKRLDLDNTCQSLREVLAFRNQVLEAAMREVNMVRPVVAEGPMTNEQNDARLQEALAELREKYAAEMRSNRLEIEQIYEQKIKTMQAAIDSQSEAAVRAIEEVRDSRQRVDKLNEHLGRMESANASLKSQIRVIDNMLIDERARHAGDVRKLTEELQRLHDDMSRQMQEYQDLMDIKVSLDLEIAAYDKLLCGEESRLHLTVPRSTSNAPATSNARATSNACAAASSSSTSTFSSTDSATPSSSGYSSAMPTRKRRHTTVPSDSEDECSLSTEWYTTNSAKGDVIISEVDAAGRFVKLHNKGSQVAKVGGWMVKRIADRTKRSAFKFHRSVKLQAGATLTVWSADVVGIKNDPQNNIVMKWQKFAAGDNVKALLYDNRNEEVAWYEVIKRNVVRQGARRRSVINTDEVEAADNDCLSIVEFEAPQPDGTSKRCIVM